MRPHQKPWAVSDTYDTILDAATATAYFAITSPDLRALPKYRSELLHNVLWLMTVAPNGKHKTRYRSHAAVSADRPTLRHDHVYTRKGVVAELLTLPAADPDTQREQIRAILREKALACVVTASEHTRLGLYDTTHTGWARYAAADITVLDMTDGTIFPTG